MATAAGRLTRIWETSPSIASWITSVDHKSIGKRYIYTAYGMFVIAGILALLMRVQLAQPENTVLTPEEYNQAFTTHGTTMIFFFATPIQFGIGNYVMPLMIGARDMAFPRLNAFGYWVFLFAAALLYSSFLVGQAPDAGWFSYVPLSGPRYVGMNQNFYNLSLIFLAISTTAGAINFIVSIFKMRAPGMSINRLPLFMWSLLTTSFAVIFALPPLTVDNAMLTMDHQVGTHFFDPRAGGNALLWQHLFWAFGHPDVYIIFLPAIGMVSTMIPVFARRPIVGYTYVVLATVLTGIIGFGVWVHHMFATGLPQLSYSFFAAASMIITIPSGVQIYAWIATLLKGKPKVDIPLLWVLGFFALFLIGGVTGVMFAAVPFDQQVTDSYFVVAHLHYVLIGGAVFPILGALYFWYPKITGRMQSHGLGLLSFWLIFIGFNMAFFPMHILGLLGMPRRIYTYQSGTNWGGINLFETIGAFVLALGVAVYVFNWFFSMTNGEEAGDNPWDADTLEWTTSSPPPAYNFVRLPIVRSRNPVWEPADEQGPLLDDYRETLGTSLLDAEVEGRITIPPDSILPLVMAIALAFIFVGVLLSGIVLVAIGIVVAIATGVVWFWPHTVETTEATT